MSIFPDKTIKDVLAAIEVGKFLQFVNYRTDTIQDAGDSIKCFCPIHREMVFRTLVIGKRDKSYRCSYSLCSGNKGGNIIDLYARVKQIDYDEALQELNDKMKLGISLPATGEVIQRTIEEGDNFLFLASQGDSRASMYYDEAGKRYQRVLEASPLNARALAGLYKLAQMRQDPAGLLAVSAKRIGVESDAGRWEEVVTLCTNHIILEPDNREVRKHLCDALLALEREQEAVSELMTLAELCEVNGDFDGAIGAFRRISKLDLSDFDVFPMLLNLLVTSGRGTEAVSEATARGDLLVERGQTSDAIELYRQAVELAPDRDDVRAKLVESSLQLGLDSNRLSEAIALVDDMIGRNSLEAAGQILYSLCEADPKNTQLLDKLVEVRKRQGRTDEVLQLQYRLVDLYRDQDDFASALMLLDEMRATDPQSVDTLQRIADIHKREGDTAAAADVMRELVQAALDADRLTDAITCAEQMTELDPGNVEYRQLAIDLYIKAGRNDVALARITSLAGSLDPEKDSERLLSLLGTALELAPNRPDLLIRRADALFASGKADEALAERRRAAELFLRAGRFSEAIEQLKIVLEKQHGDLEATLMLADAYGRTGQTEQSHILLRRLADLHIENERYAEARDTLERLLFQSPEDTVALTRLSDVYFGLGDEDMVVATTERLLAVYKKKGQWAEMRAACQSILDLRPQHVEAHRMLVHLLEQTGNGADATKTLFTLAEIYKNRNQLPEERDTLQQILVREKDNRAAMRRLAVVLFTMGTLREAAQAVEKYVEVARVAGEVDEALACLREWIQRAPDDPQYITMLITVQRQLGRQAELASSLQALIDLQMRKQSFAEVVELYGEVLQVEPDNADARARLIDVLTRLGRRADAIEHSLTLATILERAGRKDDAEQVTAEVLKLDPGNEPAHRRLITIYRGRGNALKAIEWIHKLADQQAARREIADAVETLREVFTLDSLNLDTQRRIIRLLTDAGEINRAIEEYHTLVEIHRQSGDLHLAVEAQRQALTLQPTSAKLRLALVDLLLEKDDRAGAANELFSLAEAQQNANESADALKTLGRVFEIDSNNLRARKLRSDIYYAQGDEKKALEELRALSERLETPGAFDSISRGHAADDGLPLIEDCVFENFVVGDKNNFAYAMALATAKAPARQYNPLFLYSDVGLGKTHLMMAIGNYIRQTNPKARILYLTSEDFTTKLIDAIQSNTVPQFRQRISEVDLLLVDDVQFLAGKERAQEEFFYIFNALFQTKRQIVLTSDRPPKDIAHLEKRLRSRFGAGVVVDIQPPDIETRIAIIKKELASRSDIDVDTSVISIIAKRVESNIRELKGAINQILATHEVAGIEMTEDSVTRVLEQLRG